MCGLWRDDDNWKKGTEYKKFKKVIKLSHLMLLLKKTSDEAVLSDGYYEMKLLVMINAPLASVVFMTILLFGKRSIYL